MGYDQNGFSGRLSIYFQGPFLTSISQTGQEWDQYQKSFKRLDLSLKQELTNQISVFLNLNNLTNSVEGTYHSFRHLDNGGSINGITGDLGIRLTL